MKVSTCQISLYDDCMVTVVTKAWKQIRKTATFNLLILVFKISMESKLICYF